MIFLSCVCYAFVRVCLCALWSPAGKGLTSCLSFVVSNCEFVTFPLVSWVVWYLIVLIPDLCTLTLTRSLVFFVLKGNFTTNFNILLQIL